MLKTERIKCVENDGDYMEFSWEPGATDGMPAGLYMAKSCDGSISMGIEGLVALRDACNRAIEDSR